MTTSLDYEWDVELVEIYEDGENDIIEHYHQTSYAGCLEQAKETLGKGEEWHIVLVCDEGKQGHLERSWAYMKDGKLPTHFEDAFGNQTRKVPQRFHEEVAKATAS